MAKYVDEEVSKYIPVFQTAIPDRIKVAETSTANKSIFLHEPNGDAAEAYANLVKEVEDHGDKK